MKQIEQRVYEIVLPFAHQLDLEIYDVMFEKRGKDSYLTIFIDREKGVDINDCENLNNLITDILDKKINIKEQYFLEVSSCGLERHIRSNNHLEKYVSKEIELDLFKPIEKVKKYIGILKQYTDDYIIIVFNDNEYKFNRKDISQIKSVYNWDNLKGGKK